jgi:iron complex transport system substrate-binding protein
VIRAALLALVLTTTHAWAAERVVSLNLCTDQWLMLLAPEKVAALSPLARDPVLSFVARAAAEKPAVRASAEAVLALHPDLVLGDSWSATAALDLLGRMGVPVARFPLPTDFPGIRAALRAVAARLDVPARAEGLIAAMDAAIPPPGPPATALVWEPRGLTTGPDDLMHAVLTEAHLTDLGTGGHVGIEALARLRPDLLVMPDYGSAPSLATGMRAHPAVRAIPTVPIPAALTICPGPFTMEAVRILAARPGRVHVAGDGAGIGGE